MEGTLKGIKVLDFSRLLAGPFCTMILADMGATIYKVESPTKGDDSRAWGPFANDNESLYFMSCNRGKNGLAVNMKAEEGKEIIKRMVKDVDVVVENFRNGVMDRLGLSYDVLKEINPGLIYCQITGFGQNGPDANRGGNDLPIQAASGVMSMTGYEDMPPVRVGISLCDLSTGIYAATGIVSALYGREKTGKGQKINCSLLESMVSLLAYHGVGYMNAGVIPKKTGTSLPSIAPYCAFKASDGEFVLGVGNDGVFLKAVTALNMPELAEDPRFKTNPLRVQNTPELNKILGDVFATMKRDDVVKTMFNAGVPCSEIRNVAEVCADPQMIAREMFKTMYHEKCPELKLIRTPIEFSEGTNFAEKAPPMLGEDTESVLSGFGYSKEQIMALAEKGILGIR